ARLVAGCGACDCGSALGGRVSRWNSSMGGRPHSWFLRPSAIFCSTRQFDEEDLLARTPILPIWLALACAVTSPAPAVAEPEAAALGAAERGFAAQVRSEGVRDGFLAWLSPTSVVFRPGPVNGPTAYAKQPGGWHGLLAWSPVHAAISADGKLGWSTGPWTWQRDSTQRKPEAHGEYVTVWRKGRDGAWKAVLDCGVGHPSPLRPAPP